MKNRTLASLVLCLPIYLLLTITVHAATVFGPQDFSTGWWRYHASFHTFTVDSSADGQITVAKRPRIKDTTGGFVFINGKFISLKRFLKGNDLVLEKNIHLRQNNFLVIFFRGERGASLSIKIDEESSAPPPEITFSANPPSIISGETSTLTWSTEHTDTVSIEPGIGTVQQNGSYAVSPLETTQYTLTATGPGGIASFSTTVTVTIPEPTVSINANPSTIELGNSSTLSWYSTGADSCTIEPGIGVVDTSGSISVTPIETISYTITAVGPGGTTTDSVTMMVLQPPIATISAEPASITSGESSILSWSTEHARTCSIEPDIGTVDCAGEMTVSPTQDTTYVLTATGLGGTVTTNVTVEVSPLALTITSPVDGTLVTRPDAMITGTVTHSEGLETGVTVNGVVVLVYGDTFVANHVPLMEGENAITVRAMDVNGESIEKTITLTVEPAIRSVELNTDTLAGLAALEAILSFDANFSFSNPLDITYTGPGEVQFATGTEEDTWNISMVVPGIYTFIANLEDENGTTSSDRVSILVYDRNALDSLLQGKWNGMKAALAAGDVQSAVQEFAPEQQQIFQEIFTIIQTEMAQIATDMQSIELIYQKNETAEYRIKRDVLFNGKRLINYTQPAVGNASAPA